MTPWFMTASSTKPTHASPYNALARTNHVEASRSG